MHVLLVAHQYRLIMSCCWVSLQLKKKKRKKDLPVQKGKRNAECGHAQPLVTFGSFSLQLCWKTSVWVALLLGTLGARKVVILMVPPFPSLVMPPLKGRDTRPTCKPELLQSASGCRCPSRGGSGSTCCHGAGWWWTPGDKGKGPNLKELHIAAKCVQTSYPR